MKRLLIILLFLCIQNITFAGTNNWPQPAITYVVQKGETWDDLAKKFDIPARLLQRFNNSNTKKTLRTSQRISIPEKITYKIKHNETALKIAVSHGMTFSELIMINGLSNPDTLKPGDNLKILNAIVKTSIPKKKSSLTSSTENFKLIWPVKGKVTSKFGIQKNGSHNNDIHILIEEPEIKVSAPGIVVYTGNEVGSYGNLVIVQHENNWVSSYGNLSSIHVNKGDYVNAGQVLGIINFDNPQQQKPELYFGLRIGATAVNPTKYLKYNNTKSKA